MKKLATRAAMITAVAFGIFLGGGGLGTEEAEAKYRHYCIYMEMPGDGEPQGHPYCTNP